MSLKRHRSAGGVVVRRQGRGWQVALIARKGKTVWCLPKGHIEPGETPAQAAVREVREETGLTAEILHPLDAIAYWFVAPESKTRVFKTVRLFLMRATGGSITDHDFEVDAARWFPMARALTRMSYPSERRVVTQARKILGGPIVEGRRQWFRRQIDRRQTRRLRVNRRRSRR